MHRHAIGDHHHDHSHIGDGHDFHSRRNETSGLGGMWEDYAYNPDLASGAPLDSFVNLFATNFAVEDSTCNGMPAIGTTTGSSCTTANCKEIPEPYPNAGQQACCPEGWEPFGNHSACRKSGFTDCGSPENCCDLFSNSVLGCCSDSDFNPSVKCGDTTGAEPPDATTNCITILEPYPNAGQQACCPKGWEPFGNDSACRKSGFTDCGSNLENCCDLFSNSVLGCCSDSGFDANAKCCTGTNDATGCKNPPSDPDNCKTINDPYPNAGQQACCPKGWEPFGNDSACRKSGSADCGSNYENCCDLFSNPILGCCADSDSDFDPSVKCATSVTTVIPPSCTDTNKKSNIVGYWWNCSNPATPIPSECDTQTNLIMLASFCPNPFSVSHCSDVFGMCAHSDNATGQYPTPFGLDILYKYAKQVSDEVSNGHRNLDPYVLISIGGSSFGLSDWMTLAVGPNARIKNNTSGTTGKYQCPENSYQATQTNIEAGGCTTPYTTMPGCAPYIDTNYLTDGSDHACQCNAGFAPYPRTVSFGGDAPDGSSQKCTGGVCGVPWYASLPTGWQNTTFPGGKEYSGDYSTGGANPGCPNATCPGIFDAGQGVGFGGTLREAMVNLCQKKTYDADSDVSKCDNHHATCNELLQEYVKIMQTRHPNISDVDIIGRLPKAEGTSPYLSISVQSSSDGPLLKLPVQGVETARTPPVYYAI